MPAMARAETSVPARRPAVPVLESLPFALLDDPLEYILADHFRQRSLCAMLRQFAGQGFAPRREADQIIAFLGRDLEIHHADEEEDLFPVLRRRALPEDDLGAALARLTADHRQSGPMAEAIVDALAARPADDPVLLPPAIRELMLAYAASEHRHLAVENGIVMAIARIRLKRSDLKAISRAMKFRRGVRAP